MIPVPRVHRWCDIGMMVSEGTFCHLQFAQQYGARVGEPLHDRCIELRPELLVDSHSRCRSDAFSVTKVFYGDGHAVERSPYVSSQNFLFRLFACFVARSAVTVA